jgi:cytoskeletal protein RodZ
MVVVATVPPDLLTVRHKRGISLSEISNQTKIGVCYLEAIEAGAFEKLPGGIYSTSYIRQYARAIDYDEAELLGYYFRAVGPIEESTMPAPPPRRSLAEWLRVVGVLG